MTFLKSLKYEFKSMLSRKESLAVLVIGTLFSLIFLVNTDDGLHFVPYYWELGNSPEWVSLLYVNVYGKLLYQFLCPIMACIPAACSYFNEKRKHIDALIIPAVGRARYIGAKMLTTFISGFISSTLPFVLSMTYAWMFFSRNEMVTVVVPNFYEGLAQQAGEWNIFGHLMFTHPMLNYCLHITLVGLWSAGAALLTLGISLHYRRNYFLNLLLGPVILFSVGTILTVANLRSFNPVEAFPLAPDKISQYVMQLANNDKNAEFYHDFVEPSGLGVAFVYLIIYGSCAGLIISHLAKHRKRDIIG